jgi:hypothetical protein
MRRPHLLHIIRGSLGRSPCEAEDLSHASVLREIAKTDYSRYRIRIPILGGTVPITHTTLPIYFFSPAALPILARICNCRCRQKRSESAVLWDGCLIWI